MTERSKNSVLGGCGTMGYDDFNRLSSTASSGGSSSVVWTYDRYGNRWSQMPTPGGYSQQASFNSANNQAVGFQYDAAGNLLNDAVHSYSYDAEGNMTARSMAARRRSTSMTRPTTG